MWIMLVFRAIDTIGKSFYSQFILGDLFTADFYDWRIDERIALCEHEIA